MRRAAKVDANQAEMVLALRKSLGASVQPLHYCSVWAARTCWSAGAVHNCTHVRDQRWRQGSTSKRKLTERSSSSGTAAWAEAML